MALTPVTIIHGPTRAGKSSQAQGLADRHGYVHLSSGQILRDTKDPDILSRHNTGELARSEDVLRLMQEAIAAVPGDRPIVIDGFPRKLNEFKQFLSWLGPLGRRLEQVIELYIPPKESHARGLHRGRGDDDFRMVERKWEWYRGDVTAVLDYCREQEIPVVRVDGVGAPEEVARRIETVVL